MQPKSQLIVNKNQKLDWIQALRGIAALAVVITHARYYLFETPLHDFAARYLTPAAQGVDLFFLLSGFIMVYTTRNNDGTISYASAFLIKRFARVWPVYVVIVLLVMSISMLQWHDAPWRNAFQSLAFLPIDARKPPYFSLPYPLGWTLNFEFYFYIVFAISLLAGRNWWKWFFGWIFLTLVLTPLLAVGTVSLNPQNDYQLQIDYVDQICNPIVWEFFAGVCVGILFISPLKINSRWLGWTLILASIILGFWWSFISGAAMFHGIHTWGWPLVLMLSLMALTFKVNEPKTPKVLIWLGSISYSLYLVHYVVFTQITMFMTAHGNEAYTHKIWYLILITSLSLVCAEISRRLLEVHFSNWIRIFLMRFVGKPTSKNLPDYKPAV